MKKAFKKCYTIEAAVRRRIFYPFVESLQPASWIF